jgi:hypothetical protein
MSWITDYFASAQRMQDEELAAAERDALASGKEPFDLARFEQLLNRGPQAAREQDHRRNYYIFRSELRTLAAYAAFLRDNEPWEDSR